ncbi:MAG: hypothetical protein E4H14_06420 [Candidatus Thorarchaeota archaeon]|nr:MAG: hypothetical protein E4H14_06420 [Candidatus Thorarchaeota archaeon]
MNLNIIQVLFYPLSILCEKCLRYIGFGSSVDYHGNRPHSKAVQHTDKVCEEIMSSQPYYWTDPMKEQFDIEIESILEANGHFHMRINKQVAKPAGGGQAGDKGTLSIGEKKYDFIDTILHDGYTILVMKNSPIIGKGKAVLNLDMAWRKAMMTNHTSEHIFVASMKKKYPELNLGKIWIDGIHGTVVLEGKTIPLEDILVIEKEVNRIIQDSVCVTTKVVAAGEVDDTVRAREGVTSKNDIIRLVNVGDFDSSACSGIHVTNTSDIHTFKIIDAKDQDGNTHIEFVSGNIAASKLADVYNIALTRKYSYPFEMDQLGAILDKSTALQVSYEEAVEKILQLMRNGPNKEQLNDVTFWYEYLPGFEISAARQLIKDLNLEEPSVTLFLTTGKKTNIILWTKGMPKDAAYYIAEIVEDLGGKGGGSAESYTGGFTEVQNPQEMFLILVKLVMDRILE